MNSFADTTATMTTTLSRGNCGSGLKRQLIDRRRQTLTALRDARQHGNSHPGSSRSNGGSTEPLDGKHMRVYKNIRAPFDETVIWGSETEQTACERTRDALFTQSKRYMSEEMLNAIIDRVPLEYRKRLLNRSSLPTPSAKRQRAQTSGSAGDNTLPRAITTIVRRLRLLDEPDYLKRYYSVVAYCKLANFSFSTTVVYLRKLCAAELFGKNDSDEDNNDADSAIAPHVNNDASSCSVEANSNPDVEASAVPVNREKDKPLRGKTILRCYRLDRAQFRNHAHTRLVDDRLYATYANHLMRNFNEYTAPLLLVFYTGLRNVEVRQLTNRSLHQLQRRENVVTDVMRKRSRHDTQKHDDNNNDNAGGATRRKRARFQRSSAGVEGRGAGDDKGEDVIEPLTPWMPIYTLQFATFVDQLCQLYARKLAVLENSVIVNLFDVGSPATLSNRMKCEFFKATGQRLPFGFGLHGNRTTLATVAYERTQDIHFVNRFLAHKSTKTTEIYIKPNVIAMERKFERISRAHYMPLLCDLDRALETAATANNSTNIVDLVNMIRNRDQTSVNAFERALFEQTTL